jgi:hypothetical protein
VDFELRSRVSELEARLGATPRKIEQVSAPVGNAEPIPYQAESLRTESMQAISPAAEGSDRHDY